MVGDLKKLAQLHAEEDGNIEASETLYGQAACLIEQLQTENERLQRLVPHWTKTEDGLPVYGRPVLLKIKGVVQHITYTREGSDDSLDWFEPYHYDDQESGIWLSHDAGIEWMPLPPKGEES